MGPQRLVRRAPPRPPLHRRPLPAPLPPSPKTMAKSRVRRPNSRRPLRLDKMGNAPPRRIRRLHQHPIPAPPPRQPRHRAPQLRPRHRQHGLLPRLPNQRTLPDAPRPPPAPPPHPDLARRLARSLVRVPEPPARLARLHRVPALPAPPGRHRTLAPHPVPRLPPHRRLLPSLFRRPSSASRTASPDAEEAAAPAGELGFLPPRTCAICYRDQNPAAGSEAAALAASAAGGGGVVGSAATDITNPYETVPCGCVYCFACVAQCIANEDGEGWTCLRCGEVVRECRPWSGDVLEEKAGGGGGVGKSVGFAAAAEEGAADAEGELREVEPVPERRGSRRLRLRRRWLRRRCKWGWRGVGG
jgi:hypothetical protein